MKKENWKGESEGTPSKFFFCFGLKTFDCFFVEPFDNFHGEFYRIFVIFECADSMMTVDITDRNANHDGWDTVAGSMDVFPFVPPPLRTDSCTGIPSSSPRSRANRWKRGFVIIEQSKWRSIGPFRSAAWIR